MGAYNKLFIKTKEECDEFESWFKENLQIQTKYGEYIFFTMYLYKVKKDSYYATFRAPNYVNAEVIRKCPIEFIQTQYKAIYKDKYDLIKNGTLYGEPIIRYEKGKHFVTTTKPNIKVNNNGTKRPWLVMVDAPSNIHSRYTLALTDESMWYIPEKDEWGFVEEFINKGITNVNFSVRTIKALKRKIRKWELPIGSIVTATDVTLTYKYQFKILK